MGLEKNRILNHSVNHSPSLFDTPGTEAFASQYGNVRELVTKLTKNIDTIYISSYSNIIVT